MKGGEEQPRLAKAGDNPSNFPILMFVPQKRKNILKNLEISFPGALNL
jgi:hypothetical protein